MPRVALIAFDNAEDALLMFDFAEGVIFVLNSAKGDLIVFELWRGCSHANQCATHTYKKKDTMHTNKNV